jgi:hypothetical protein
MGHECEGEEFMLERARADIWTIVGQGVAVAGQSLVFHACEYSPQMGTIGARNA